MYILTIRTLRSEAGNELYINGLKADSAMIARMMERADTGFQWGTDGTEADLTAVAICYKYIDEFFGGMELSPTFKFDFVKNWPADQDIDVQIDMDAHYESFRSLYWVKWWEEVVGYDSSKDDQPFEDE